jgi:hypothetical protein
MTTGSSKRSAGRTAREGGRAMDAAGLASSGSCEGTDVLAKAEQGARSSSSYPWRVKRPLPRLSRQDVPLALCGGSVRLGV